MQQLSSLNISKYGRNEDCVNSINNSFINADDEDKIPFVRSQIQVTEKCSRDLCNNRDDNSTSSNHVRLGKNPTGVKTSNISSFFDEKKFVTKVGPRRSVDLYSESLKSDELSLGQTKHQGLEKLSEPNLQPHYFIKTEISPSFSCPLHGRKNIKNKNKITNKEGHQDVDATHVQVISYKTLERYFNPNKDDKLNLKTNSTKTSSKSDKIFQEFNRSRQGQFSLRIKKNSLDSKLSSLEASGEQKPFSRRWSLRMEKNSPESTSFQSPTISSVSKSNTSFLLELPDYFKEKSVQDSFQPSYTKLSPVSMSGESSLHKSANNSLHLNNSHAMKPLNHSSTQKNCGILKSPGKRRVSANNRVDFLDNLREKEIPGRET